MPGQGADASRQEDPSASAQDLQGDQPRVLGKEFSVGATEAGERQVVGDGVRETGGDYLSESLV